MASLAELVSMMPTTGGQYHWVHEMSPPKYRKFLSWITGWQVTVAWQADLAAVLYLGGTSIQALVVLNYPDYNFERWHATLMMWAIILVAIFFNTALVKLLSLVDVASGTANIAGFFVVIVPILYFGPRASAHDVFAQYLSLGSYSDGTAWFVGLITPVFTFLGVDCVIHMSEEVRHARLTVPRAMIVGVNIQGLLGFGMLLAVFFTLATVDDITTILTPVTGSTFVDYFNLVLHDVGFATGLTTLMLVLFILCAVAVLTTASRITWAFARDDGIPGSGWIRKVHAGTQLPLYSIGVSACISMLLSLINIGSSVAFNAVVSLTVASFFGSYFLAIVMLVWKRLTAQSIDLGPWSLGRFGLSINLFALGWLIITFIFSFFPIVVPVVPETMNWSCVLYGFIMLFGLTWYAVRQRKFYTGPKVVLGAREGEVARRHLSPINDSSMSEMMQDVKV